MTVRAMLSCYALIGLFVAPTCGQVSGESLVAPAPAPRITVEGATRNGRTFPAISPDESASRENIVAALKQPIRFDFQNTPLADVAAYLGESLKIPVHLDNRALQDVGIGGDRTVTLRLRGTSARAALRHLLRSMDLTWMTRGDVLLITTPDESESNLETRVYEVSDLVVVKTVGDDGESANSVPDFDSLIEIIVRVVAPISWDEVGGPGSVGGLSIPGADVLVLSQTPEVHEQVARLLVDLRRAQRIDLTTKVERLKNLTVPLPQGDGCVNAKTADDKLRVALAKQKIDLDLSGTALTDTIDLLRDKLAVPIVIDHHSLDDLGITLKSPVSYSAQGESAAFVMTGCLRQLDLTWLILDEAVVITAPETVEHSTVIRVYDVLDLVIRRHKDGELTTDFDTLLDTITAAIVPDSWDEVGGPGTIAAFSGGGTCVLVVSQAREVHDELGNLLIALRKVRGENDFIPLASVSSDYGTTGGGSSTWFSHSPTVPPLPSLEKDAARDQIVVANSRFACNLYEKLRSTSDDNVFFSPYSLSASLTMVQSGARGETARELALALQGNSNALELQPDDVSEAWASLRRALMGVTQRPGVQLRLANRLWGQRGDDWKLSFLTRLSDNFGGALGEVDFQDSEVARQTVNSWVARETEGQIRELFGPGVLTEDTRLVLANAVYFRGDWKQPFLESDTKSAPFFTVAGRAEAPLMYQQETCGHAGLEDLQVLEKRYADGYLSMVVLLPKEKSRHALAKIEDSLSGDQLQAWLDKTSQREVKVYLPKFKFDTAYRCKDVLKDLGIRTVFDAIKSDLQGICETAEPLYLDSVVHKASIDVNEKGTEAAAATGGGFFGGGFSAPAPQPPIFRADHPFLFLIRDTRTGTVLFLGRVMRPQSD